MLDAAPRARVVTTFIAVGILGCERQIPLDRVYLLNPGQTLDVGDRTLAGYRPPLYDNPATVGFIEDKTGAFFSSDCFGGPMISPDIASAPDVRAAADDDRQAAQLMWAAIDSPWVQNVDLRKFLDSIQTIRVCVAGALLGHGPARARPCDDLQHPPPARDRHERHAGWHHRPGAVRPGVRWSGSRSPGGDVGHLRTGQTGKRVLIHSLPAHSMNDARVRGVCRPGFNLSERAHSL